MELVLYIDALIEHKTMSAAKSGGFIFKTPNEELVWVRRMFFAGDNIELLLQKVFMVALDYLSNKDIEISTLTVYFPIEISSVPEADVAFKIHLLSNMGLEINFQIEQHPILVDYIKLANYKNFFKDDLRDHPVLLMAAHPIRIEDWIVAKIGNKHYQYLTPNIDGYPGSEKIYLTLDDLASYTNVAREIAVTSNLKYPIHRTIHDDLIRSYIAIADQCDLGVVSARYVSNIDELSGIAIWMMKALQYFDKPIYFLDPKDLKWKTKSVSKKRDWVTLGGFNWLKYKNIGCFLDRGIFKLIKGKVNDDLMYIFEKSKSIN